MSDISALEALANDIAGKWTQTLTSLLGRDVVVNAPVVKPEDANAFLSGLTGSWLVTTLKGMGGFPGSALLLTGEKNSAIIADLLIGQDGTSAPERVTELHLSAFGEVVQQLIDAINGGIQQSVGSNAGYTVLSTESKTAGDLAILIKPLGSPLVFVSFALAVPGLIAGEFWICLPDSAVARLSNPTGKPLATQLPKETPVQPRGVSNNAQMNAGGALMQQFEQDFSGSARQGGNIGLLLDVPLKLTVELGRTTKLVKEILALAPGSVVELDKLAGEAVDILVNEKPIAKGEVVVIDENFGVRITEILNPEERLTAVQA